MKVVRGQVAHESLAADARCPFFHEHNEKCDEVRAAELRTREETRCDGKFRTCLYYFIWLNRKRQIEWAESRPEDFPDPSVIRLLDIPDDWRPDQAPPNAA